MNHRLRLAALVVADAVLLPLWLLLGPLALAAALLPLRETRVAAGNLRRILGMSPLRARLQVAGVYLQDAAHALEAFLLGPLGLTVCLNEDEFAGFLRQRRAANGAAADRGFLVLGAHLGTISAAGSAVSRGFAAAGLPRTRALAKPRRFRATRALTGLQFRAHGIPIIWTGGADLVRSMRDASRRGESLKLLVDQKPPRRGGCFIRFLGEPAAFPDAGVAVGVQCGMPVLHAVGVRVAPGIFRLAFAEGYGGHLRGATRHDATLEGRVLWETVPAQRRDAALVLAAYALWLEPVIRDAPSQWCWHYPKWSRRPRARPGRVSREADGGHAAGPPPAAPGGAPCQSA